MNLNSTRNDFETVQSVLQTIISEPEKSVIFSLEGRSINPGYHVTEVKHASVSSLDCGQGSDSWEEIVIQLLDGSPTSVAGHMSGNKFLSIVQAATGVLPIEKNPKLYFEYSPENRVVRKLIVDSITTIGNSTTIQLAGEAPRCKAFERALQPQMTASSCCGSNNNTDRNSCDDKGDEDVTNSAKTDTPGSCC